MNNAGLVLLAVAAESAQTRDRYKTHSKGKTTERTQRGDGDVDGRIEKTEDGERGGQMRGEKKKRKTARHLGRRVNGKHVSSIYSEGMMHRGL